MAQPIDYEDAIRYVHDCCERNGVNGAGVETFDLDSATPDGDWPNVRAALRDALTRIKEDASDVPWSAEEASIKANFEGPLERAIASLDGSSAVPAAYLDISLLVHALKALVLKARGTAALPRVYAAKK